ncbi:hypothetical protein JCM19294_158 [Nonlabens tegetincola]|uniref:Uncharacterized protein n=1 Tax=Nonlabens tegetincola TaxID=323273 RepID=A0A090Q5Y8_9FLAO|nr:hypothetical protein JCM19294_158 [Nonlabens tegetincola]
MLFFRESVIVIAIGLVQQKVCTDNAVVKSGKLYAVQCHVGQSLSVIRAILMGRQIEVSSNTYPR